MKKIWDWRIKMQTTIQPITQPYTPSSTGNNSKKSEQVAIGVGGAAGVTTTAHNMAAKRGLYAKFQRTMSQMTSAAEQITENTGKATSLWNKFKINTKAITKDVLRFYDKLAGSKFVGGIFKSAIVKKSAAVFGGALAFFTLISGVNKAAKTTVDAAGDFKHKLDVIRA